MRHHRRRHGRRCESSFNFYIILVAPLTRLIYRRCRLVFSLFARWIIVAINNCEFNSPVQYLPRRSEDGKPRPRFCLPLSRVHQIALCFANAHPRWNILKSINRRLPPEGPPIARLIGDKRLITRRKLQPVPYLVARRYKLSALYREISNLKAQVKDRSRRSRDVYVYSFRSIAVK